MNLNGRNLFFVLFLALLATVCKFFFGPDLNWSGFSPVIAIAIFAGYMVGKKEMSFMLPLVALLLSDVMIHLLYLSGKFDYAGFYTGQWKNYLILLAAVVVGWKLKGKKITGIATGAIVAPTLFFFVSNLVVWASSDVVYAKSFAGLVTCLEAGLPFYKNSLRATVLFLPVILISYNYFTRKKVELTIA